MVIEPDGPGFNRVFNSASTGRIVLDRALSASWIFGEFFIESFPAHLSYTCIYRYATLLPPSHQPLSRSSLIPYLFLAQRFLNYSEKVVSGTVLFGLALIKQSLRWRYSRISRTG